jgi:ribonuclease HI
MEKPPQVTIFTDGSCHPNPGAGGWAALLQFKGKEKELTGSHPDTTNNRMELTAAVEALSVLKEPCQVRFYTDSQYVKNGITKWLPNWRARNWRRKSGALANIDLWQSLDAAIQRHEIAWKWVKSHAGHPENERVDILAKRAVRHK